MPRELGKALDPAMAQLIVTGRTKGVLTPMYRTAGVEMMLWTSITYSIGNK